MSALKGSPLEHKQAELDSMVGVLAMVNTMINNLEGKNCANEIGAEIAQLRMRIGRLGELVQQNATDGRGRVGAAEKFDPTARRKFDPAATGGLPPAEIARWLLEAAAEQGVERSFLSSDDEVIPTTGEFFAFNEHDEDFMWGSRKLGLLGRVWGSGEGIADMTAPIVIRQ